MGIVYKATNKIDGTSYIGATRQTLNRRITAHHCAQNGMPFVWALREYGRENFEWRVLYEVPNEQLYEAEEREILAARECGERLYNVSNGPGLLGMTYSLSPDACARIGARHRGKVVSSETRAKLSAANKGKAPPNAGGPRSPETRAKIAASLKGRPAPKRPRPVFQGKSYKEWAEELGVGYYAIWHRIRKYGNPYSTKEPNSEQPNQCREANESSRPVDHEPAVLRKSCL